LHPAVFLLIAIVIMVGFAQLHDAGAMFGRRTQSAERAGFNVTRIQFHLWLQGLLSGIAG
jgi:ribose/xylose/arabinose/galactoside ABC-type transport system permease subunit